MSHHNGIVFRSAPAFWIGAPMVAGGVLAHLPDFVAARGMHYQTRDPPLEEMSTEPDPEPEELAAVAAG